MWWIRMRLELSHFGVTNAQPVVPVVCAYQARFRFVSWSAEQSRQAGTGRWQTTTNSWHQYNSIKLLQHQMICKVLSDYLDYIPAYWGRSATQCSWISHSSTAEKHLKVVWSSRLSNKSANLRWEACQWIAASLDHPFPRTVMPWGVWKTMHCLKFKVQLFQWFRYVFEGRFGDLRDWKAERLCVADSSLSTHRLAR